MRFSLFKLTKKIFEKMFHFIGVMIISVLTLMVYLPRVFANNEKVFSFHYFYLRNKILTLKFLTFFKICIISMINFKTFKVFFNINFIYNKLQYLLFALHRIL